MTAKEQSIVMLRDYIKARRLTPWIASYAEQAMIHILQELGGMAGTWRNDYSECTYYHPQRINGELVDLSTVEKVRAFYERSGTNAV